MFSAEAGRYSARVAAVVALLATWAWPQQPMSSFDRDRAQTMLRVVGDDVRKHYYDPTFHGLHWDAILEEAKQKIEKAPSFNMALSHIAAALIALNDSHTFFLPPRHMARTDYGFQYQMVGDRCFVTRVRPKSDAETKGLKAGDEILALEGYKVSRETLWQMQYAYAVLRPQPGLRLDLRDPAGNQRKIEVASKFHEGKLVTDLSRGRGDDDFRDLIQESENQEHLMRARFQEYGDQLLVLKVPEFNFSGMEVDSMIGRTHKFPNLIVDLRGNPGGAIETLKYLAGGMFDKQVKIGDRVGRKENKPELTNTMHSPFTGKLIVLVDARSASAAELFAHMMQIEKRAVVVGDHTSGSVMEARRYRERFGTDTVIFYGASITEWDLIMADGKSLEHVGVTPDEVLLPSAQDMADGRDPVLAHAAELLGVKISPEVAGKAFPYEWPD